MKYMMLPGELKIHTLCHDKLPDQEYDAQGIPFGIQPDPENPYRDSLGNCRSVAVYRPSSLEPLSIVRGLFVVGDTEDREALEKLMVESCLADMAERYKMFVIFPLPGAGGWNVEMRPDGPDDVDVLHQVLLAARLWYLFPDRENCHEDVLGMVGVGRGADMAQLAVAAHPEHVHSLMTFGGELNAARIPGDAQDSQVFVWQVNPQGDSAQYWMRCDGVAGASPLHQGDTRAWRDPNNFALQVRVSRTLREGLDPAMLYRFWEDALSKNMRIPDAGHGKIYNEESLLGPYHPSIHKRDRCLGDNGGMAHDWLELVPERVLAGFAQKGSRCPLVISMHGGGSWPEIAAAESQLHLLGEEMGFITVYPNASRSNSWNSVMRDDRPDDVAFIVALVEHMKQRYPVDPTRVYVSGFSNGSGMAHLMAAIRPDLFAGLIAFNTRFPIKQYVFDLAGKAKEKADYRMPVFSTYGTRDAEYPLQEGCGQFSQMRLWKWFNNIEDKPLNPQDPSGVGAPGDRTLRWGAQEAEGQMPFTTHSYLTRDPSHLNLYNYTLVEGLPHTVDRRLTRHGWNFVAQFTRQPDGSLGFVPNPHRVI